MACCIMPAFFVFVLAESALNVGRDAGVQRAVLAQKHVYEIHTFSIPKASPWGETFLNLSKGADARLLFLFGFFLFNFLQFFG